VLGVERVVERGFEQRVDPYLVADRLFSGVLHAEEAEEVNVDDGMVEERAP
jgi:hypothetical protein